MKRTEHRNVAGTCRRAKFFAALAGASAFLLAGKTAAFTPVIPERVHIDITSAAAGSFGFSAEMEESLWQNVVNVDTRESTIEIKKTGRFTFESKVVTTAAYVEGHHFDRGTGIAHADAFAAGATWVRDRVDLAVTKVQADDNAAALAALGEALHALQDFHSHSNLVDLAAGDRAKALEAVWDATKAPPAGLMITAFFKGAAHPGAPDGDAFGHDKFCKDSSGVNAEARKKIGDKTKFQIAKELAITSSTDLLSRVRGRLTVLEWSEFIGGVIGDFPLESQYKFRALAMYEPGGTVVGAEGTTVAFGPGMFPAGTEVGVLGVPYSFAHDDHDITARDGSVMAVMREIRPQGVSYFPPAAVEIAFDSSDLSADSGEVAFDVSRLGVYFADQLQGEWVLLPDAAVGYDSISGTGLAAFDAERGGVYAVGAPLLAPEPTSLLLMLAGAALWRMVGRN
jgi:hypothetical protein